MLFIKFLKHQITETYRKLTILGRLLLTLQIASMFVPIIDPNNRENSLLVLLFFLISFIAYIPISIYLVAEYSLLIEDDNKQIADKDFFKRITIPFTIIAAISIMSVFMIEKIAIIQYVLIIPAGFLIYGHIAYWIDNLPEIKLPKLNFKKLFVKDTKHKSTKL